MEPIELQERVEPIIYEIRIKGRFENPVWTEWFENVSLHPTAYGQTIIHIPVVDQSALYGILARLP